MKKREKPPEKEPEPDFENKQLTGETNKSKLSLDDDEIDIIEACIRLFDQTFESNIKISDGFNEDYFLTGNEFTADCMSRCIQFCMNLPGNSELCVNDRAKLLKYGAYEIALLRLAYRYDPLNDGIILTNGSLVQENHLADEQKPSFKKYGHTFFSFCRKFARFSLEPPEFSLICAIRFFSSDRQLLNRRDKVFELQNMYLKLFEYMIAEREPNDIKSLQIKLSQVLLSFSKLQTLDVLSKS